MSFAALDLIEPLLRAIREQGYVEPTPIQVAAIPAILSGRDVWACAQTGSGKTAAFALPILQRCMSGERDAARKAQALIIAPTRELAAQIGAAMRNYTRYAQSPVKIIVATGGVSLNPQMMSLRGGAGIVVATPGRLLDLIDHNALSLDGVATLVLDEADRLLDLGFAEELARILELLPTRRQNLLFSATFPPAVHSLAERLLRDPVRIEASASDVTPPDIEQRAIEVDASRRTQLLRHLIQQHDWRRVLVFVATKYATEHVAEKLRRAGLAAAALHGELSQGARTQALADFKAARMQALVATDLAARGIDIEGLPAVVNFDLPRSTADYIHRIGRTGRAGASGVAVSFITAENQAHFRLIEARHRLAVARERIVGFEPTERPHADSAHDSPRPSTGGVKGKRKSRKDKLREAAARSMQTPSPPPSGDPAARDKDRAEVLEQAKALLKKL